MSMTATAKTAVPYASDAERWEAVMRRDRGADGAFDFSVLTTGVYCRPSCAARQPLRENVRFHANCAAAERAGFRPCKRCRPNASGERQAEAVAAACRLIAIRGDAGLDVLAAAVGHVAASTSIACSRRSPASRRASTRQRRARRAPARRAGRGATP